jgi:hypothetical protein
MIDGHFAISSLPLNADKKMASIMGAEQISAV